MCINTKRFRRIYIKDIAEVSATVTRALKQEGPPSRAKCKEHNPDPYKPMIEEFIAEGIQCSGPVKQDTKRK